MPESNLPDDPAALQEMVRDLRKENADRRTKMKNYEESFSEFNDQERAFLLDLVKTTAEDPGKGAIGWRDLAFQMLKTPEAFLDGLDIELPEAPAKEEETETEPAEAEEGEENVAGLTKEELDAALDAREKVAAEAAAKAQQEKDVQEIFAEIEALGFEQGTEGFMGMLSLAQAQANSGKDVDFAELAPKVRTAFGIDDPAASEESETETETTDDPAEKAAEKAFPSTSEAGGAGGAPTEQSKDWVAEAKESGRDPFEVARERASARLDT